MLHRLIPQIGFAWSVRTIGFVMVATFIVPNTVMKVRVLPAKKRAVVDTSAFRSWPYMLFVLGGFIGFMGLYTPFFYVQYYSISKGITDQNLGFYLLAILNSASVFGRIIPNFVADKLGPMNIIIPCALISGILIFCLIPIDSVAAIMVFNILYGFFSGSFVSLPPTILVHLTPNRALIGTRMGMCFGVVAVGVLVGTPIAGAILDAAGFTSVWIFGGTLTVVGGLVMLASRFTWKGFSLLVKA
jgi:predicted MFS family arabinose efflux permease